MADNFFGFDTSLGAGLDNGDCLDDEDFEEDNYDALNDETFGSEAVAGDWEQDHEKLSQITESNRPRNQNDSSKSESEIDVESSLSHLVFDEKDVTIPRPGVWDSPTNFPVPPSQSLTKQLLSATLKNACTVEELERGLITSRPPPGLGKLAGSQQPPNASGGNLFLNSITSVADKLPHMNGVTQHQNQYPLVMPPRLGHPMFQPQNSRPMPNQPGNLLRYPMPIPNLMMPLGNQRQPPLPGNFPMNPMFPHPPNPGMGPLPFINHPMMPHFNNQMQQHNMHMGNQRNQNKQFNHNDRQDNHHQPFFRSNQHYYQNHNHMNRFQNQGHYGHHMHNHMNNHHYHMGSNGIGPYGEYDEYAGLMNNREKQWLNNIQLLQLNTNQPYIDDYYYTVFCDRMNKKNEIQSLKRMNNGKNQNNGKGNNNNNNNSRDSRDRDQNQHTFTTKAATTPMQFENSLGKLQYSSVTAPRKIIDMDVVSNSDSQQSATVQQKDTKKTKQLLLEIERLYMLVLKLEDRSNPLAIIAEHQRDQQLREQQQQQHQESGEPLPEMVRRDPLKEKEELIVTIMGSLLQLAQEDKFSSFLSIRKGKTLFLRFLSCIDVKENKDDLRELWSAVIRGLPLIGRRDSQLLTNFYTELYKWADENCIKNNGYTLMMSLVQEFLNSTKQPSKNNSLTFALTNKFGISVIGLFLKLGDHMSSIHHFTECWVLFLRAITESIGTSSPVVAPYEFLDHSWLKSHLDNLGLEYDIECAQTLTALELFFTEANPAR